MAVSVTSSVELSKPISADLVPKIWVLGSKSRNADRSIPWDAPFPNFAEPDILIINLQTLDDQTLHRIDSGKLQKAMSDINEKFLNSTATLVIIPSGRSNEKGRSSHFLSPMTFNTVPVQEGHNILIDIRHPFAQYLNKLKSFDFYLDNFDIAPEIPEKLKRDKRR